eukprot:1556619-Rhodomonas_salina.3
MASSKVAQCHPGQSHLLTLSLSQESCQVQTTESVTVSLSALAKHRPGVGCPSLRRWSLVTEPGWLEEDSG